MARLCSLEPRARGRMSGMAEANEEILEFIQEMDFRTSCEVTWFQKKAHDEVN